MEMRFWKPFPRPDLVKIVSAQVDLLHLLSTAFSVRSILTIVLK